MLYRADMILLRVPMPSGSLSKGGRQLEETPLNKDIHVLFKLMGQTEHHWRNVVQNGVWNIYTFQWNWLYVPEGDALERQVFPFVLNLVFQLLWHSCCFHNHSKVD